MALEYLFCFSGSTESCRRPPLGQKVALVVSKGPRCAQISVESHHGEKRGQEGEGGEKTAAMRTNTFLGSGFFDLSIPIGSMVLLYMLTWLGYIDGIHVTIYSIHGSYGIVFSCYSVSDNFEPFFNPCHEIVNDLIVLFPNLIEVRSWLWVPDLRHKAPRLLATTRASPGPQVCVHCTIQFFLPSRTLG